MPAGNQIVVQFRIDLSGLLTVTATEKRSGLVKSVTIDTAGQHRINLDAARTNLAALFADQEASHPQPAAERFRSRPVTINDEDDDFDDRDDEGDIIDVGDGQEAPAGLLASAKSLRNRAEKLLKRGVAESDAATIHASLAEVAPAIEARAWQDLAETLDTLSDLLFYLDD